MLPATPLRTLFHATAVRGESRTACELLAEGTGLPKLRVKDAMRKGAVWLKRAGAGEQRLRRAQARPRTGDRLSIYFDAELLARVPPAAECLHDAGRFSVWFKPAGLMTQGTRFGDHCSLLRQAEVSMRPDRQAFPVHRLDREASGLVIVAHDRGAAAALSRLFAERRILKRYRVELRGPILPAAGRIELSLDGKPAVTDYVRRAYDPAADVSVVEAVMQTGRKHQIRRHFALTGVPVMGDPLYGRKNKNAAGLKLRAWGIEFTDPFTGKPASFKVPAEFAD